jgi:hypothetical protein
MLKHSVSAVAMQMNRFPIPISIPITRLTNRGDFGMFFPLAALMVSLRVSFCFPRAACSRPVEGNKSRDEQSAIIDGFRHPS